MERKILKSFKDLTVWQKSSDLAVLIYKITDEFPRSELYGLANQMRRSVISISSNIAEGFKRNYKKEKIQFYHVAYGSAAELESQVEIAYKLNFLDKQNYQKINFSITEISKMIGSLIKSVNKNSPKSYILYSILFFLFLYSISYILYPKTIFASTTDGTINAVYKYAWSENMGWLNFGTSGGNVHITDTTLTGYVWSQNYAWINLNPTKAGVTNNGNGTLSGYAWGQNCGWINFNGVTIDSNGEFSGYASGSISGDISFECTNCIVKTDWRPRSARPACNNALDDDSDGKIDYPADPGCSSLDDTDETDVAPPGGGGGGGGGVPAPITQVVFSGRAYPLSKVTILKDGQIAITTIAGLDANFNVALSNLSAGSYLFSVFSEDSQARRSSSFNFPVNISQGATTTISGIFLSPTIDVDKIEVRRGDNIVVLGQSVPEGEITINISSDEEFFVKTKSDKNGAYLSYFDTSPLVLGQHLAKSKTAADGLISSYSPSVGFAVGTKSVPKVSTKCPPKADLNSDCKVNLIDFSIAAYWYKRTLSESFKKIEKEKLNGDGKVTLVDFSIMAYYWTG